jgi:hypothetical protein
MTGSYVNISSDMHQSHNIPWHLISSNFEFKENDRRFTPPRTGLVSKDNPNASQELNHFIRKFAQAIRTFSETERAKYPDQKLLYEGNVFSDELKMKYPDYLNDTNQRIQYWMRPANPPSMEYHPIYGHDINSDIGDIVKILLYENELAILIMMAHHPNIPIARLNRFFGSPHTGFCRLMETALRAYLYFNSAEATNTFANGEYTRADEYQQFTLYERILGNYHHVLLSCDVYDQKFIDDNPWVFDIHLQKDLGFLKEYIKTLFAILYRYDLLLRECGIEPGWETEIAKWYPINKIIGWN